MPLQHALLVDDNAVVRKMVALFVANLDFSIDDFGDPSQALDAFKNSPGAYDVVITDINMTGMTGLQLADRIRGIRPGMPIIFISGVAYPEHGLLIEPKTVFVSKPMTQQGLAEAINAVLRGPGDQDT